MTFTKTSTKEIQAEVREAMNAIAEKHGLKFEKNNARYSDLELKLSLSFSTVSDSGETKEAVDFKNYCGMYGLKPEALGMTFKQGAHMFTISGILIKKTKNVVQLTRDDGKSFMAPADSVGRNCPAAKAPVGKLTEVGVPYILAGRGAI